MYTVLMNKVHKSTKESTKTSTSTRQKWTDPILELALRKLTRNMWACSHYRNINRPNTIKTSYLRYLYKKQNGKCFYSGVKMKLSSELSRDPLLMSVDRFNTSLGYINGNVVLCCLGMNLLKGKHTPNVLYDSLKLFYEGAVSNKKVTGANSPPEMD